ncbi:alpha/beta fold hydrolase [Amnibacterium kyonggiense]|uniref:Pimeloyl-ACP methyl ester carboxylesterase n=1 Tax=Amnibacterium kyonggiense TaxID=595671 RepID=A0A4R7FLA6_9MICO|nr:alpha/beta hydrolase [Amnibacterium kyonggiense]TDS77192.1 pimeloyl-ACP methyl ester carboxylesterase [Amnibacterium kyonggiense]
MQSVLDGIEEFDVATPRLRAHVLDRRSLDRPGESGGPTVVLIHGNVSSSLFFQPLMLALPPDVRALAIDLRGFGGSETLPVDATRGLRDFSDDVASVLDELGTGAVHLVGWSMGAGVALQLLLDRRDLVWTVTLESPVSPYGFGGTALDGTILNGAAGSGGGGANPDFVRALEEQDRGEGPASPRTVYRTAYVAHPEGIPSEDLWVESMLTTRTGLDNYPGDSTTTDAWPGFGPGTRGVLNTMTPDHLDLTGIVDIADKPPILWIRGEADAIVSDASFFDLNTLGAAGIVPGWPGAEVAPSQPMVSQTRAVLDRYAAAAGSYRELALPDTGHAPHLERQAEFVEALVAHVRG